MFRNRTNSQKPGDTFYKDFKASYPALRTASPSAEGREQTSDEVVDDSRIYPDHVQHTGLAKDGEPTPRGPPMDSAWHFGGSGLTPSVLDPSSNAFNSFANQMPGYYTPTPGGHNTLFHSQHAGDLHTPGLNFGLGTPLSMPTSEGAMNAAQQTMNMQGFHHDQHVQQGQQQLFQNMAPFQMHNHPQQHPFSSHQFSSSQITLQPMHARTQTAERVNDVNMDMTMQSAPGIMFHPDTFNQSQSESNLKFPHPLTEKFRYHVTLNAPTAMVKHEDEIPVTYLNKGQAYTLNVTDNAPVQAQVGPLRYRTFVRVSFEDPDQRKRPAACWQLWKEGRGTNEAHLRGGRLQAVEYADPSLAVGAGNDPSRANIELESASFDGFCVTWTPATHGGPIECPIPVRFNFLSTDFSHSKGVKGIPVRLCAKTELLLDSMSPNSAQPPTHETCYCRVKLFRDHGAERKLSNDIAHVKKSIEKVNQQIAQMEAGLKDLGKRKRSSAGQESQRPGKLAKHRRGWSLSSADTPAGRTSAEDELHMKLLVLQEMFSSTRPSSVLFLRGEVGDDPDEHPVRLTGEPSDLTKVESIGESAAWEHASMRSSTMVSPTPSSLSVMSGSRLTDSRLSGSRHDSSFQPMGPPSRVNSNDWNKQTHMSGIDLQMASPRQLASPPDQPVRVQAVSSPTAGKMSQWIESLGVDASYRPPPERAVRPVACFYVQPTVTGRKSQDQYYRAIYLMRRTLKDFVTALCLKLDLEPTQIMRTVRVKDGGFEILLDDQDIVELPEGQDMKAVLIPVDAPAVPVKTMDIWDTDEIQVDGELPSVHDHPSSGYELSLSF